ncbi:hypothetical protein CCMSSC00406_0009104 [Pleurotus cornucopiae]|uniref:Uncharacterized protein n=1 Tax=Pleurotus cornucopiae TaxID=5321 RepID=A0ACB7J682_PLECO|nr:hypothetical protein CCMSSC00406_0009104 [Pleurotus cornucopiae]
MSAGSSTSPRFFSSPLSPHHGPSRLDVSVWLPLIQHPPFSTMTSHTFDKVQRESQPAHHIHFEVSSMRPSDQNQVLSTRPPTLKSISQCVLLALSAVFVVAVASPLENGEAMSDGADGMGNPNGNSNGGRPGGGNPNRNSNGGRPGGGNPNRNNNGGRPGGGNSNGNSNGGRPGGGNPNVNRGGRGLNRRGYPPSSPQPPYPPPPPPPSGPLPPPGNGGGGYGGGEAGPVEGEVASNILSIVELPVKK